MLKFVGFSGHGIAWDGYSPSGEKGGYASAVRMWTHSSAGAASPLDGDFNSLVVSKIHAGQA